MTLTINLDLNDPNDDGKLRTAEIRDLFAGNATCVFDAKATIEAFIAVFVEIELRVHVPELGVRPAPARPVHALRVRLPRHAFPRW